MMLMSGAMGGEAQFAPMAPLGISVIMFIYMVLLVIGLVVTERLEHILQEFGEHWVDTCG